MTKSRHIAIVCNYELKPDRIGGMDRFFKAYNQELLQKGHRLTWFFAGKQKVDFYSDFNLHLVVQQESVETFFLNFLKEGKTYDVVVTHFIALCTSFYKKIKQKTRPYIIAVDHNPRPLNGFSFEKRIKNKIKGKLYSKYIDLFVGVSQYTVDCILYDYGIELKKKTVVVYNGIETSVYQKRTEENYGKFIVASHLRKSKGIQDLITAVSYLPEPTRESIEIDIFGEGPLEETLRGLVKSLQLEKQFKFFGSTPQLHKLFKNYSYMFQPTYMECFSLSILESLAANVPVITTPVGGNPEIIIQGKNGLFFEPGNVPELKNLIMGIMDNSLSVGEDVGHRVEENYNLKHMVNQHIILLKL